MPVPSTEAKYQAFMRQIAKNVRKARTSRDIKQIDMTKFGFEMRFYQRLESGEHSPSLYTIFRLARAFECEVSELLCT